MENYHACCVQGIVEVTNSIISDQAAGNKLEVHAILVSNSVSICTMKHMVQFEQEIKQNLNLTKSSQIDFALASNEILKLVKLMRGPGICSIIFLTDKSNIIYAPSKTKTQQNIHKYLIANNIYCYSDLLLMGQKQYNKQTLGKLTKMGNFHGKIMPIDFQEPDDYFLLYSAISDLIAKNQSNRNLLINLYDEKLVKIGPKDNIHSSVINYQLSNDEEKEKIKVLKNKQIFESIQAKKKINIFGIGSPTDIAILDKKQEMIPQKYLEEPKKESQLYQQPLKQQSTSPQMPIHQLIDKMSKQQDIDEVDASMQEFRKRLFGSSQASSSESSLNPQDQIILECMDEKEQVQKELQKFSEIVGQKIKGPLNQEAKLKIQEVKKNLKTVFSRYTNVTTQWTIERFCMHLKKQLLEYNYPLTKLIAASKADKEHIDQLTLIAITEFDDQGCQLESKIQTIIKNRQEYTIFTFNLSKRGQSLAQSFDQLQLNCDNRASQVFHKQKPECQPVGMRQSIDNFKFDNKTDIWIVKSTIVEEIAQALLERCFFDNQKIRFIFKNPQHKIKFDAAQNQIAQIAQGKRLNVSRQQQMTTNFKEPKPFPVTVLTCQFC